MQESPDTLFVRSGNVVVCIYTSATRYIQYMRSPVNAIVAVLLLVSATVLMSCSSLSSPDPTRVTNLHDNGAGSLRQAVASVPSGSTITFDPELKGTIMLTSGDLRISRSMTIRGPGASILAISSGKSGHTIEVLKGATATLSALTFKDSERILTGFILNEGTLFLSKSSITGISNSGIYNRGGALTLSNSIVSGNSFGGIYNMGGILTLSNSIVSHNMKPTDDFGGGGIYNAGMLTLTNSIVSDNWVSTIHYSSSYGGGIYNDKGGTLILHNSTISGNSVSASGRAYGGGIYNEGTLTITNSTVSGNTSLYDGGGIASAGSPGSQTTITFCTIYSNKSTYNGGGLSIENSIHPGENHILGHVVIRNTLIASNSSSMGTGSDVSGTLTTDGYNLIQHFSGATFHDPLNRHSTDIAGDKFPSLGIDAILRDNGGLAIPHTFTYALLPGSPAIDAIPADACQVNGIFPSDQRGVKRPDGKGCDIGAYEYRA